MQIRDRGAMAGTKLKPGVPTPGLRPGGRYGVMTPRVSLAFCFDHRGQPACHFRGRWPFAWIFGQHRADQ